MGKPHVLPVFVLCMLTYTRTTLSIPFIVLPGLGDECKNQGVKHFTELLSNWSGSQGYCIKIGDGSWDSWTMPLMEQTTIACEKVAKMFASFGSQGNMIGRGLVEFCDGGPQVKNFISLAGPHAGTASLPFCGLQHCLTFTFSQSQWLCVLLDDLVKLIIYSRFVQEHLGPSNYFKIPTDIFAYINGCKFLPKLNNEIMNMKNYTYKLRFASLENLVLIMFEQDAVLIPKETSWFGYFPDGAFHPVLPAQETKLYTEDWIGLKTLDEAGKVKFIKVSGNHLEISVGEMKRYIVPFLKDQASTIALPKVVESSSGWQWSLLSFAFEMAGLNEGRQLLRIMG
ncbi:palmitoyl-protein thioesterase 1-like isoform X2 [Neltuma alba]|uniref:palmitoyl-protein thioesterase 1-like isoform X2 n=1 Tax=Neltuma alba TaxID=207710 RepID=UPI0010A369CB|nr:palmitoyl-protein thioesterase 1-like isoform X2 [Prosopis alba]